jgi:co-chaperonin GroES (HSP10)
MGKSTTLREMTGQSTPTTLELAFPEVDPGVRPFGSRVLVQIRSPRKATRGGLILPDETKDTERWNTQVAKVIALGPVAFKNRTTLQPWPEGDWARPGAFVRVPKYGGDRWEVSYGPADDDKALFVIFDDLNLVGEVTGDPLAIRAFV